MQEFRVEPGVFGLAQRAERQAFTLMWSPLHRIPLLAASRPSPKSSSTGNGHIFCPPIPAKSGFNPTAILVLGALTSFFASGGAGGPLFAYTSEIYPTRFRAAGTGWAAAWQRIGGIVAPPTLGSLLGAGVPGYTFFAVMGGVLLVGGIGGYLLGYETRGKSLERITADLAA